MKKKPTGTREWASTTYNIGLGCKHNCLYCYSRQIALRWKRIKNRNDWENEKVDMNKVNRKWHKRNGVIMIPSQHDVSPYYLPHMKQTLINMLEAGNKVLIVTKPHYSCIDELTRDLIKYKSQILFRFTIGTSREELAKAWEHGAPTIKERISALKLAFDRGFKTSVSSEPMLGDCIDTIELVDMVRDFVTDSIWLGKMNDITRRVDKSKINKKYIKLIEVSQDDKSIKYLYGWFKNDSIVKYKDSIKKVVGIKQPEEIGLDI